MSDKLMSMSSQPYSVCVCVCVCYSMFIDTTPISCISMVCVISRPCSGDGWWSSMITAAKEKVKKWLSFPLPPLSLSPLGVATLCPFCHSLSLFCLAVGECPKCHKERPGGVCVCPEERHHHGCERRWNEHQGSHPAGRRAYLVPFH